MKTRSLKFTFVSLCVAVCFMSAFIFIFYITDAFGLLRQTLITQNDYEVLIADDNTKSQIYYIDSAEDLNNVRYNMYQKNDDGSFNLNLPNTFIQICDIDMTGSDFSSNSGNFDPIASDYPFNGTYLGNGFSILNLNIVCYESNVGLFSTVGETGKISSLKLVDCSITGGNNVGAIAGTNDGTISLVANYATIQDATNVGGIAGINNGTIEKSFNCGNLQGTNVGGISVQNTKSILNCFNIADIENGSGIALENSGSIANTYNVGNVNFGISQSGTVQNSYYLQGTTNQIGNGTALSIDQFVGMDDSQNIETLLNANQAEKVFRFDHLYICKHQEGEKSYQFPHIVDNYIDVSYQGAMQVSSDGKYHIIDNAEQFNAIGVTYNEIAYSNQSNYLLNIDIDCQSTSVNPIQQFLGEFNGNSHKISNLSINTDIENLGLFYVLTDGAYVHNLTLSGFSLTNTNTEAESSVGSLAGEVGNNVIIENVFVENSYVTSNGSSGVFVGETISQVSGGNGHIWYCGVYNSEAMGTNDYNAIFDYTYGPTGGFIGKIADINNQSAYISNCYVVSDNNSAYDYISTGDISMGGFIGEIQENSNVIIQNCIAVGHVYSGKDYVWGSVQELDCVGGFIGINNSSQSTIQKSYAKVTVSRASTFWGIGQVTTRAFGNNSGDGNFYQVYALSQDCDGSSGATDIQESAFNSQSTFSGFDFQNDWAMSSIGGESNIPVPNKNKIVVTSDDNSTITLTKDNNLVATVQGETAVFDSLADGQYTINIIRFGQTVASTYNLSLSTGLENYMFEKWFYSGSGTQEQPYVITSSYNFEHLSNFNSSAYFSIQNNVNFENLITTNSSFGGNIEGNNKNLYNFKINGSYGNNGLFTQLDGATFKNVNIYSFEITSKDADNTGVIAGEITNSTVENVNIYWGKISTSSGNAGAVAGTIKGTTINSVGAIVDIETSSQNGFSGILVGVATQNSLISKSYTDGKITGENNIGGFIGNAESVSIQDSYTTAKLNSTYSSATSSVIGGFAGAIGSDSSISRTFMFGSVKASNMLANVGVFAGTNSSQNLQNNYAWNVNNYRLVFSGDVQDSQIKFLTTDEFASSSSFVDFQFGEVWTIGDYCPQFN